jgi:glycosyltransferase involved in cell wall biosynthesis
LERLSHGVLSDEAAAMLDRDRPVDVLVGIPSFQNARTIGHVVRAVEAGLRKHFPDRRCLIAISDGNSTDGTVPAAMTATIEGDEDLLLLDPKVEPPDRVALTYVGMSGKGSAFRAIFELAATLEARACAVLDADLRSVSPAWIDRLVGPVLGHGYDLVTPLYARHKLDGTITNSIAFPLTAALYGRRLRQPIGGDFGFSGRLATHWAGKQVWSTDVARFGVDIWMTTVALCEGFSVCQSVLGAKLHDAKDPGRDLGPMFRQVVGSLFALAGRYVDRWASSDGIVDVPTFGFRTATSTEEIRVSLDRLIWRFVEGYVAEHELWEQILAPQHFDGVKEAISQAGDRPEGFVLPVELWARICCDYLLAYNTQEIDHDRLVSSMIPLYFARTATFVRETADDSPEQAEERIAAFAEVFLAAKPYLIERWSKTGRPRRLGDQRVPGEDHRKGDDTSEFLAIKSP